MCLKNMSRIYSNKNLKMCMVEYNVKINIEIVINFKWKQNTISGKYENTETNFMLF